MRFWPVPPPTPDGRVKSVEPIREVRGLVQV